jgi:hypothetical protein
MIENKLYYLGLDFFIAFGVTSIIAYSPPLWYHSYYHFVALSYLFAFIGWALVTKPINYFRQDIAVFFVVAGINNLMDEIMDTTTNFNFTEYLSAGLFLFYIILKYLKRWIKNQT